MSTEKSYGVNKQTKMDRLLDLHMEELCIDGFTVLENVLDIDTLEVCREKLDEVYEKQKVGFGEDNLIEINEKNLVRCPLVYDDFFLQIANHKKVMELVNNILGDYVLLHLQNGIINMPNEEHHQSSWHRDLPYQNFVISNPLALGALFCIDDFTESSGSTFVVSHSHRVETIPSQVYVKKHCKQVFALAGSVILFDSMIFHKAGYNSSNKIRRAINNVYTTPILKQQINLPLALKGKYSEDVFLSKFLGYQSSTPSSDVEWRERRLKK